MNVHNTSQPLDQPSVSRLLDSENPSDMNILSESEVHATVEDPANSLQPSRHLSDYTIPLDDTARAAIGI